ncbi:MAG: tRNA (cytidine(34)-2'-O)-methyltransferase [Mollicutes bacterium PWAP]|nr:tRNA (cytidine(34)-2'-O)-methyltransferase [Mollicutes bacterium PWAP]
MINIVLYQPEIAPNTGNIIRTCHATESKLHIILPASFDLHPKWFKRSGAGKWLSDIPHEIHKNIEEFNKLYLNENIYYASRYGKQYHTTPNYKININEDIFIMFGRESTGLPHSLLKDKIEKVIRIPMVEEARSLNLATTVMLLIYEVHRQNNFNGLSKFEVQKGKDFLDTK